MNFELEKDENSAAEWLENIFGGEIHRVPRITDINNNKMGCKTPDYIFRGERFELKTIEGNTKRTIDTKIKRDKIKATNFLIDIRKSKMKEMEAIENIKYIYNKGDRNWVNIIILKNDNKLIKVFMRK